MGSVEITESKCDVLIVGAGPAGLMMAAWMARCGIDARIIDKRGTKIYAGQADGLQLRSLEIFDSFGFADRAWKEANHMLEICMWNPDSTGRIQRSARIPDTTPGQSRFKQIVVHQGRVERWFLDHMRKHSGDRLRVERGVLPESLVINDEACADHSADSHPVTVTLRHLSDEEATPAQQQGDGMPADGLFRSNLAEDDTDDLIARARDRKSGREVVRARYVVGCDGAHSWTRRQLGYELHGEPTDFIWGVLDIIPITDFPDIRMRCAVHSADSGSMMVIPRENKLVRLYIQLNEIKPDAASGRADRTKITPATILRAAQNIIKPYTLTYEHCSWWTAYQIGQRLGGDFDYRDRVFLAGDAVHTHSPKAGQGMNVSMQDAYNLGWKLALVTKGVARPEILRTYHAERRRVAEELIEFDHKFSRLFSGRPAKDVLDAEGVSMAEFQAVFEKGNLFASGLSVDYADSLLVAKKGPGAARQDLATGVRLGMRFPSFRVLNQSDGRSWHLQQRLKSDGRFRLVVFAGDVHAPAQKARLEDFCGRLASSAFLKPYLYRHVDVLTCHSARRVETELLRDFPAVLHPFDEKKGWDYDSIYVDDENYHDPYEDAYANYGVDREVGCVVLCRPDQYVGFVGKLDGEGWEDVEAYFKRFLM
ncbi:hypothetical protein PspLS_08612 [Pyricularia sp. CBS 133598]|nr:hypothetical protein PspLS_08612 [Pyricularia sp. CBS 133598]